MAIQHSVMTVTKKYNGGQWTQARFNSFIKGGLRNLSLRWPPKARVKKRVWIERGLYWCEGYGVARHHAPATLLSKSGRIPNIFVDHISPVVGPEGFTTWDELINRLFCEEENLQVLCKVCHDAKTQDERKKK